MRASFLLLALSAVACLPAETVTVGTSTTSTTSIATTTSTSEPATTSTTQPATPTTQEARTTSSPPVEAAFAVSQVVFGDHGYVEVMNYGGRRGDPGGRWLIQGANRLRIPSTPLEPDTVLWVAVGDGEAHRGAVGIDTTAVVPAEGALGTLDQRSGEMGLSDPNDPLSMISYVAWGGAGQAHHHQAVEGGIWTQGGFVEIPFDSFGIRATTLPPIAPDHWLAQVGG